MSNIDLGRLMKEAFGIKPTNVHSQSSLRTLEYYNELSDIVKGLFDVECPDEWSEDYFLDLLIHEGKFCITDTSLGVIPLRCSVHGVNVFNRPYQIQIANPVLNNISRIKGVTGEIVYLKDDKQFKTLNGIISRYAQILANIDAGVDMNITNCKVPWVFDCADKKQSDSVKKMYDTIQEGNPIVTVRGDMISGGEMRVTTFPVKQNFIVTDLQDAKRTVRNEFLTLFGVNNANTDKRARLNTDEVNANNGELEVNISLYNKNLAKCTRLVNAMYPDIKFSIKMHEYVEKEVTDDISRLDENVPTE